VIHVQTDGTKPGFNFLGGMDPYLQVFTGYRWKKFGAFFRFIVVAPQGDWFNLAVGFAPTYTKTADAVHGFSALFTVRCILTVSIDLQARFGARDPEALARVVKKIYDDMEAQGRTPIIHDLTQTRTLGAAIEKVASDTPPKDKGKLN
jgi:hypothetical protein